MAGFDAESAEGEPPNSTVVLRFADTAAAWVRPWRVATLVARRGRSSAGNPGGATDGAA